MFKAARPAAPRNSVGDSMMLSNHRSNGQPKVPTTRQVFHQRPRTNPNNSIVGIIGPSSDPHRTP
ncbi:hypothetical protein [Ornithinimicrobium kibberense]|uniref:hypothetical protein n=1 Tax=Ornithinimicrobium kibberense TaxID=282060 RepID=UPI00361B3EAB